jgi:hypothetical protein
MLRESGMKLIRSLSIHLTLIFLLWKPKTTTLRKFQRTSSTKQRAASMGFTRGKGIKLRRSNIPLS